MKVRFQADADLKHAILSATLRREPTIDFRSATLAGLPGRNDMEVLTIAAQEGRVLVSHDSTTMPSHFAEFICKEHEPRRRHRFAAARRRGSCRRTGLDLVSIRRG